MLDSMREHMLKIQPVSGTDVLGRDEDTFVRQGNAMLGVQEGPIFLSDQGETGTGMEEGDEEFNLNFDHDQYEEYIGNIFNHSVLNFGMDERGMSLL